MITEVLKRNGDTVPFDRDKIKVAVEKAMLEVDEIDEEVSTKVARRVTNKLKKSETSVPIVDSIHVIVENTLMDMKLHELARKYITYRDRNKPDIYRERKNYKPFEYPHIQNYTDAIHQSFWVVDEFNFSSSIHEYHQDLNDKEKTAIQRSMLATSQIEARFVKTFWSKVYDRLPKPEISDAGAAFANNEGIHARTYSQLLEYLGLNEMFDNLDEIDCLRERQSYLKKFVAPRDASNREYMRSILLFSMFIENVSLFGQFLIMTSFDNYKNKLTTIGNVVQSTANDESVHAMFGAELINIIRQENPDWFDNELVDEVHDACRESMEAETKIIDWIFEKGDLDFISKEEVIDYLRWRFNKSMEMIDFPPLYEVRQETKEKFQWFEMQVSGTVNPDFFARRNINYTKANKSFDEDSLF
jgi:ribonucleoside-diphosphate reductase beta chain